MGTEVCSLEEVGAGEGGALPASPEGREHVTALTSEL